MAEPKMEMRQGELIRRGPYPEMTWPAVLVGWGLGVVIAISISYAALKLGFSIEGSELAAILGWGVLRGLMGRTSILENNINQTIASAVNGASSGIMFSIPALFILNHDPEFAGVADFNIPLMIFACIAGAFVGLAFVIPLRKQMIDFQRLPYPSGIAVATILKSPGAGIRKAILLFSAAIISAIFYLFFTILFGMENYDAGAAFGLPPRYSLVIYCSLMTVGVGFLSGKGGFWFGAGGFICYWLLSPIIASFGPSEMAMLVETPGDMRGYIYKPTGIGMLIGAAIGGIIMAFPLIRSAIGSMNRSAKEGTSAGKDEMPIKLLATGVIIGALSLMFLAYQSVEAMSLPTAILMTLLGILWIWIAGVIVAECIGRTNWSPLSGMTLIAVTILIVIANAMGMDQKQTIVSSMVVGAAICLAISQASDMMLDLKSGYLVGGVPRRQQMAQFIGAWLGPCVVMVLMLILAASGNTKTTPSESNDPNAVVQNQTANETQVASANPDKIEKGFGSEEIPAAQASALASVIKGLVKGNVPAHRYTAGGILGWLLAVSGLGGIGVMVALGFYMPFNIVLTYTFGCLLRVVTNKAAGHRWAEESGIPIAAGLIIGEALMSVAFAIYKIGEGAGYFGS
ncbi:MAG: OPT/YSL family transporter [Planctomycetota bacterium]